MIECAWLDEGETVVYEWHYEYLMKFQKWIKNNYEDIYDECNDSIEFDE